LFARVVMQRDAPLCPAEARLQERGDCVTRLLAAEVLPDPMLDSPTLRLLGKLYDGLIVPHESYFDAAAITAATGVPAVFDDQDPAALDA
jgi:hypothetical protein